MGSTTSDYNVRQDRIFSASIDVVKSGKEDNVFYM